ncbi:MAG TPA: TIGR04282 family arsenosugar biosynthesis glycosyltransferase [Trebonia sp.]|nr:TIGR04282 family arsenosugar biosynthesis glycosyltransferase [Trebonia sp.]
MSPVLPVTLIVIAKTPVPGQVKTRLTPPFSPQEAAQLAQAALADTLEAVAAAPVARRVLALAAPGEATRPAGPGGATPRSTPRPAAPEHATAPPWVPAGFEVIPQRGGGLDERLAAAFTDAYGGGLPMVLIGMDTPQVTAGMLTDAATPLLSCEADAVLGPAADGGFWLLGLRAPNWSLLRGVPMSRSDTGQEQLARLRSAGLRVALMPELSDVDYAQDAMRVAASIPESRFASVLARTGAAATTK